LQRLDPPVLPYVNQKVLNFACFTGAKVQILTQLPYVNQKTPHVVGKKWLRRNQVLSLLALLVQKYKY
jgi:hypothetical protein